MVTKKKLKIAQVAPIWYSLPPEKYSGIERVAYYLTEELVKRGHQVTLFASGNSKTSAELNFVRENSLAEDKIPWSDTFWELEQLSFSFRKAKNFDLIHSHIGLRALFFQDFVEPGVIHTFHNPVQCDSKKLPVPLKILKLHGETTNACFLSQAAKDLCPINLNNSWVAYNGIDTDLFKFNSQPEDFFLWVGRVDPYKGIENVVEIAKRADIKLYLAGKIDPEREKYFNNEIKPNLSEKIKFLGELTQKELAKLYQKAKALLYPIEWNEPFGLVMAEAQACGTPVITFDLGSTSEVVKNEKTGFVIPFKNKKGEKNIRDFVKAINKVDRIERKACRERIEDKFSIKKMVDRYEDIYYELLEK